MRFEIANTCCSKPKIKENISVAGYKSFIDAKGKRMLITKCTNEPNEIRVSTSSLIFQQSHCFHILLKIFTQI